MEALLHIVILVAGFILLIKGADFFVDGAAGIAAIYGISQMIIGLTIVAMGTSAPEAAISIYSAVKGSAGLAIGNVVGSNIINIILILGVTAMIAPLTVKKGLNVFEMPVVIGVTILLGVLGLIGHRLSRVDGIIFLALFACYLTALFIKNGKENPEVEEHEEHAVIRSKKFLIFMLLAGIVMIVLGSNFIVNSATWIAKACGVSDRVIGLTIVAIGTSLPELVTCIVAATKKKSDIALGNILGSNLFNILFVLGMSVTIMPLPFENEFLPDMAICLLSSVLLLVFACNKKKTLNKIHGAIFLIMFAVYYLWIFME